MLQPGRSRVRDPMRRMFFKIIYPVPPIALDPEAYKDSNNEYHGSKATAGA
jgi:hypothetical protein